LSSLEHRCEWRDKAEKLEAEVAKLEAEVVQLETQVAQMGKQLERVGQLEQTVASLQRHIFGKSSEKMPSIASELQKSGAITADPEGTLQRRREAAQKKRALPSREIHHRVREDQKTCPKCGGGEFTPLGDGRVTEVYEWIPARLERQLHIQEKLRCRCGETILTADGTPKVYDKARYGPGFLAHVVVSKCADSIPLYRQAKQYRREGVPIDRSTLVDLFHRTAELLSPLVGRLLALVAEKEIVLADETTLRVQAKKKTRIGWLWSFIARDEFDQELIAYVFSKSRSGETPARVLEGTMGKLLVDGYTGYNRVTLPGARERAGCLAHLRRKFFEARNFSPAAQRVLDLILEIYKVERAALDQEILGTPAHLAMRQERSKKVMDELKALLLAEHPKHLPKGPMGEAIGYALAQWDALTLFLTDAHLPIDNNASERALRIAALGRKNFLFVGHNEAGENLAGLYSLIATCEANGVNPTAYLTDVLIRIQTHPASRIDELLPHRWQPSPPNTS
jgi:transposase